MRRGLKIALSLGTIACVAAVGTYLATQGSRRHVPVASVSEATFVVSAADGTCDYMGYGQAVAAAAAAYKECVMASNSIFAPCDCPKPFVATYRMYAACPGAQRAAERLGSKMVAACAALGRPVELLAQQAAGQQAVSCDMAAYAADMQAGATQYQKCLRENGNSIRAVCTCSTALLQTMEKHARCEGMAATIEQMQAAKDSACMFSTGGATGFSASVADSLERCDFQAFVAKVSAAGDALGECLAASNSIYAPCDCPKALEGVYDQFPSCPGALLARDQVRRSRLAACKALGRDASAALLSSATDAAAAGAAGASQEGCNLGEFAGEVQAAGERVHECLTASNSIFAPCDCPKELEAVYEHYGACPGALQARDKVRSGREVVCRELGRPADLSATELAGDVQATPAHFHQHLHGRDDCPLRRYRSAVQAAGAAMRECLATSNSIYAPCDCPKVLEAAHNKFSGCAGALAAREEVRKGREAACKELGRTVDALPVERVCDYERYATELKSAQAAAHECAVASNSIFAPCDCPKPVEAVHRRFWPCVGAAHAAERLRAGREVVCKALGRPTD